MPCAGGWAWEPEMRPAGQSPSGRLRSRHRPPLDRWDPNDNSHGKHRPYSSRLSGTLLAEDSTGLTASGRDAEGITRLIFLPGQQEGKLQSWPPPPPSPGLPPRSKWLPRFQAPNTHPVPEKRVSVAARAKPQEARCPQKPPVHTCSRCPAAHQPSPGGTGVASVPRATGSPRLGKEKEDAGPQPAAPNRRFPHSNSRFLCRSQVVQSKSLLFFHEVILN